MTSLGSHTAFHCQIGDLVQGPAVVVDARTNLRAVAKTLGDLGIGLMVVIEDGKLAGVVSERDLVWAIARDADLDEVWAADVMTLDVVTVAPDMPLGKAAASMISQNARHILVEGPELPAVVSMRDVVAELTADQG